MYKMDYNKMYNVPKDEEVKMEIESTENAEEMENTIPQEVEVQAAVEESVDDCLIEPAVVDLKPAAIINCGRLNVREHPDPEANVLTTIGSSDEVMVSINESVDNYYRVCTVAGIEGYCVKDYLQLK